MLSSQELREMEQQYMEHQRVPPEGFLGIPEIDNALVCATFVPQLLREVHWQRKEIARLTYNRGLYFGWGFMASLLCVVVILAGFYYGR